MNYSGILVIAAEGHTSDVVANLNTLSAVEVHQVDEVSRKIIAVQEADSVNDEVSGLKQIKKIPGVILAEMVSHYFIDSNKVEDVPDDLDELTGLPSEHIPEYLNN